MNSRLMTACPLCGFKQRLNRLVGVEPPVNQRGELLPLRGYATMAQRRVRPSLFTLVRPVGPVPAEWRAEYEYALGVRLLPIIRYLSRHERFAADLAELLDRVVWHVPLPTRTFDIEVSAPVSLPASPTYDHSVRPRLSAPVTARFDTDHRATVSFDLNKEVSS